jgi:glycosyltransferase involved in cell wall biosynthesis
MVAATADESRHRLRILHVATRHRRGGAEKNLIQWIARQLDDGHEVAVAVGADGYVPNLPEGATVHVIGPLRRSLTPLSDLRAFWGLRRIISRGRFDIVHTHQSKAGVIGRLAAHGRAPVVLHTVHMASFGNAYSPRASRLFIRLEQLCARFTDVMICVGDEMRQRYVEAKIGTPDQYTVVRSPVDVDRFAALRQTRPERRGQARSRWAIPVDRPLIVSVGALDERKRHALILRELAPMLRTGTATLAIAGDGPERERLGQLANDLDIEDAVKLLGFVDDIRDLLIDADALIHASKAEGVPQAVIESLAAGVPVIAALADGIGELPISPEGLVGLDCSGLACSLQQLLSDPPPACEIEALSQWRPDLVTAAGASVDRAVQSWLQDEGLASGGWRVREAPVA